MKNLRILMAASEAAPFAWTGGLGDVIGSLPSALADRGIDIKVIIPWYGTIDRQQFQISLFDSDHTITLGDERLPLDIGRLKGGTGKIEFLFAGSRQLFDRQGLYVDSSTGMDHHDNARRFAFFNHAVLKTIEQIGWQPDIIHCHDWPASLIPALLKQSTLTGDLPKTILTIHNLAYQGSFPMDSCKWLGLPSEMISSKKGPFEFQGKINFLKGGILLADRVSTVSQQYAREIRQRKEFGCGLQEQLKSRNESLVGILNGIDDSIWTPKYDRLIPFRYHSKNLSGKRMNKVELLRRAGLPAREKTPLIGMVSRLVEQKGIDLLTDAASELLKLDLQLIVLGTGRKRYHKMLSELASKQPDRIKVFLSFDNILAHWIVAGADMFLMPSRYEPCGLNQMYALNYGTVPIVRRVGGLAETVIDADDLSGQGNGFLFDDYNAEEMLQAIYRAIDCFGKRQVWRQIMKRGMQLDFSWDRSAQEYIGLYHSTINKN